MKQHHLIILLSLSAAVPLAISQEALFPLSPHGLGGHGGPHFKFTTMDGKNAVIGGGLLGIAINPGFSWLVTANYLEDDVGGLEFGYGAIGAETSYRQRQILQPMAQVLAGFGQAERAGVAGPAFVGELSAMLGIQVGRGEKIILGLGYRMVPMGFEGLSPADLSGPTASLQLATGNFRTRKE